MILSLSLFQPEASIFTNQLFTSRFFIQVFDCDLSIDFFWWFSDDYPGLESAGLDIELSLR